MTGESDSIRSPASPRLAVTTRSRLKSSRLFFPMLSANVEIKRQLDQTCGCLRFASVVMGPRDFWSISLWRSRGEMLDFMRSGAHERLMWNVSRWFDSFWLMRWAPTDDEVGTWDGLCSRRAEGRLPGGDPAQQERATKALASVPELLAAVGPEGAPTFESAPAVRASRERVGWANGGILRLRLDRPGSLPGARGAISSVRHHLVRDPEVLRFAYGAAGARELFAFAIFRGEDAWRRFRDGPAVSALRERSPDDLWIMRWTAEHEFGHWDRLRVRTISAPAAEAPPVRQTG